MEQKREVEEDIIEKVEAEQVEAEQVETEDVENLENEESTDEVSEENPNEKGEEEEKENPLKTLMKFKDKNKRLSNENEALKERLLRVSAEYENYRKRTIKEKEGIYTDACVDVLKEILPVIDNLERALSVEGNIEDLKKGIEMTIKGVNTSFEKLGVNEIDTTGQFDPNLHQAVMHIQDEELGENVVAEVFQKGYKKGDKVLRHTMVKVAN
ncbi:nucleotide exchange factor GrpE [Clostridium gasigenes]|uniref:Protein GrpE n=1 Tax=Clostridium gasigenes TaxID=94869 RepID=A0A1H0TWW9_9CLOT|nr:nucleotide exchange factor GrpE [Clostridium gasigenes]MBB6624289.1 nucleotide exchange factor GrpE [Clostridium gasigenes]MBB6714677.1 nucleotide exchange factor GrpE [Clostridium gasigenes]MBU3089256.1 nucleotide exchange factor GrpE [Clostridium gasigenes]MBU3132081.1 nucleotide exchange factor GrpE [Clostridium gasigenes]SDP58158.1 molecular chaperone GrpE [Clostridium gasigenes]